MRKIKIVFLFLIISSYLNAGIVMNFDKGLCENNCEIGDSKCNDIMMKTCDIILAQTNDTIETEAVKTFTEYIGSAIYVAGESLLKTGVISDVSKFNRTILYYLGQNGKYIGEIFKKNGPMYKNIDKTALVGFAIDMVFDIISNEIIEHYNHEACSKIRALPGIHDNAPDDTIRQALKWIVKLAYNDLKATIYYSQKNYWDAVGAGVVDNTLLLADIGLKTVSAREQYFNSKIALEMSLKRGELLKLYYKYERLYLPLRESDTEEKKLKEEIYLKFYNECKKIKISFFETQVIFRDELNSELGVSCSDYWIEMKKNNSRKQYILSNALTFYSRERYNKMIEYYFHKDDWDYYKSLYNVYNFNPAIGFSKNSAVYKYVKKLYAYGVNYESSFTTSLSNDVSILNAAIAIKNVLSIHYGIKKSITEIVDDAGYTLKTKLTRKVYGQLIYTNFNMKYVGFDKNQMATFKQLEEKRTVAEATLAAFKIIHGYRSDGAYNIFSNKAVKSFKLVQMLADSLDIITCGHKDCSYEEILKGAN